MGKPLHERIEAVRVQALRQAAELAKIRQAWIDWRAELKEKGAWTAADRDLFIPEGLRLNEFSDKVQMRLRWLQEHYRTIGEAA